MAKARVRMRLVSGLAECLSPGCGWYVDARNASGVAARHKHANPDHSVSITMGYSLDMEAPDDRP